jgi:BTB/POZ domain
MSYCALDTSSLVDVKEISREECFSSFLTDEELTNVSLIGNDGVIVRANRHLLSARSVVFRKMLKSYSKGVQRVVIPLDYKGSVLKAVVEYVATDYAEMLRTATEVESTGQVDLAHNLVSLIGAATSFSLPVLSEKAYSLVGYLLWKQPAICLALLEACNQRGPSIPHQLKYMVMYNIQTLDTTWASILSASTLEEILKDRTIVADEYSLFELVQKWAEAVDQQPGRLPLYGDSKLFASSLVKNYIRLDWIDPELLSTSVASSGLVSDELLSEAFSLQAIAQEKCKAESPPWQHVLDWLIDGVCT